MTLYAEWPVIILVLFPSLLVLIFCCLLAYFFYIFSIFIYLAVKLYLTLCYETCMVYQTEVYDVRWRKLHMVFPRVNILLNCCLLTYICVCGYVCLWEMALSINLSVCGQHIGFSGKPQTLEKGVLVETYIIKPFVSNTVCCTVLSLLSRTTLFNW